MHRATPLEAPRAWRIAAALVLPYFLLGVLWAITNPPGAAPDERDHLAKAIAAGHFSIGTPGPPAPEGAEPTVERNSSIARVVQVPADLYPGPGYACFAFQPDVSAACLPKDDRSSAGSLAYTTPVGAYPPFLYVPLGWAASLTSSVPQAFLAARMVVCFLSSLLLLLGVHHLVRWLGRGAVLGVVAALTPMAVYLTGVVSLSSLEMMAAVATACVVAVAIRHPESIHRPATHWTLAAAGTSLALSRQLGVVALAVLGLVLLSAIGWGSMRRLMSERQPSFVATVVLLAGAAGLASWWEITFDHPVNTGPVVSSAAVGPFMDNAYGLVVSAIGNFGWLDTPLPGPMIAVWIAVWSSLVGTALLVGSRREALSIGAVIASTMLLSFAIYASVFLPVGAQAQGRHFLPLGSFCLVVGGVVTVDRLATLAGTVTTRLFLAVAAAAGSGQAFALYWNARRYAVGLDGPLWFRSEPQWSPYLGWTLWLLLALAVSALLTMVIYQCRPREDLVPIERGPASHVER